MSEKLTIKSLTAGRCIGVLSGAIGTEIEAVYRGKIIAVAKLTPGADGTTEQTVELDLPMDVISDGVQVIALRSTLTGEILEHITLMAGSALEDDVRGEIALLREELEMLKRAFRRHCMETGQD